MNSDKVKGAIDDAAGRAKRKVGEWTGDTQTQVEGATQQVKGKLEKAWANLKDVTKNSDRDETENDDDLDRDRSYDSDRP